MRKVIIYILVFLLVCPVWAADKPYRILNSFSGGELSELLSAREDLSKYHSGCSVMENMFPLPQGGAQKRPGTVYVATSKNNTKIQLLPFEYSTEQSYAIELGNQYARFFTNKDIINTGAGSEDISALDNKVAHWLLNDNAADTVVLDDDGATHNGTATANTETLHATAKVGTGCFDLDAQYAAAVTDNAALSFDDSSSEPFSIFAWVYITQQSNIQNIISKWKEDTAREYRFSLSQDRKLQLHLCDDSVGITANRVAQYYLNDDAADTHCDDVTTNHDGVIDGANSEDITATGKINASYDIDGQYAVEVTDHANLSFDDSGTKPFSVAAWVYVTGTAASQVIFAKHDTGGKREYAVFLSADEKLAVNLYDESASAIVNCSSDDVLTTGWHFVVMTYDSTGGATAGTGITLYVDGEVADSTVTYIGTYVAMEADSAKVSIGAYYVGSSLTTYFADKLDNVILFNIELTSTNILNLYNNANGTESLSSTFASAITDEALTFGWHQVAVTYTGAGGATAANGIIFYVDGVAVASTATNDADYVAMEDTATTLKIGCQESAAAANEKFWGDKIDEISMFSDVLSASEISTLYAESPYEVTTPYLTADLFNLKIEQSADVLYITHPSYEPRKLSRLANANWSLDVYSADAGPFRTQNSTTTGTIAASATTGTVTLTASGCTPFEVGTTSGHEPGGSAATSKSQTGALFKLVHPLGTLEYSDELDDNYTNDQTENISWMDCGTVYKDSTWYVTTLGTWTGTLEIQRNYTIGAAHGAAGWETVLSYASVDDRNVETDDTEDIGDASYRAILTESGDAGEQCKVYFRTDQTDHIGIVQITSVSNSTSAVGTVLTTLGSTNATHKWSEGSWSNYRGWPRTVTFFEDRLVFGGNASQPDTIWASVTGDYENMLEGVDDDDALLFTLSSRQVNVIEWMIGKDKIHIGTSGAEWTLSGSSDEAITPTNVKAEQHSTHGSHNLQATLASESVLFFQRGAEKMRELAYNWEVDSYVAPDMTMLNPEVTGDGITDTAFQKTPNAILWCVKENGDMAVFVYERKELITSWSRLITDDDFESVAVITGDPEDEVWVSVKRTIGGNDYRYIEYFSDRDFGSDIDDAFYVDSGVTYDSTATTTITGLSHLEGETVAVLGDGVVQTSQVVSGGQITITSASTVQVGLPYTVQMRTMPLSFPGANMTILGRIKRINEVIANWVDSGDFSVGKDASTTETISISGMSTDLDRITFPPGHDRNGYVFVYQQSPEPLTLISLAVEFMVQ